MASSSSLASHPSKYDVFLNFRGDDTGRNFSTHLYAALLQKGVLTCSDVELERGKEIAPSILQAIQNSTVAVLVFSKDYASSGCCLDELAEIITCCHSRRQIVVPILYEGDPAHLRKISHDVAAAFVKLKQNFKNAHKISRWSNALFMAALLRNDHTLINKIVEDILKKPNRSMACVDFKHLVTSGIKPQRSTTLVISDEEQSHIRMVEGEEQIEAESFSAANTLGLNMDPTFIILPNGKFMRGITSWQKGELLGSGFFGTVYEGFTDDGFFFAVKEVSLLDQDSHAKQSILQLEQEISLLRQFKHENIIQYLGTDKDESKLYIFLELATKGSLSRLYEKYHLRDSQVSIYSRQILSGLKYLHDQKVVHRDIKCANILVDASGSVKLSDFGLAKAAKFNDVRSSKGTPFWMAPEVVNLRNGCYGLPADIWSLGCTVLEMLTRRPPYSHLEPALYRIGKGEPPEVPDTLSRDAQNFILKCLQVNPNDRPSAAQLLNHPFVQRPSQSFSTPSPHIKQTRS